MKKMIIALLVVMSVAGCGSHGNKDNSATDNSYKSTEGVQNVNGNIPDTGNLGATPHTEVPPRDSLIPDSGAVKPH